VSRFSPKNLFNELRRRRVFNTIAIYIVGAWVALQVADQAFPALDIPERAIRFVWLGAFLLFPLVLVFGWRYDITDAGISRTDVADAKADAGTSLRRPDRWLIGSFSVLALAVIGVMLFEISRVEPRETTIVAQENSIAVMPFGVCEDRHSDLPLAGGLTSEVISRLAQRDRLKVIGRATTFNLATFGISAQEVSELTRTEYVLNGTLCREGIDLTLDAEMTNADGYIVWSERFTEVTNRFDEVEDRLARLVSNGISLELGDVVGGTADDPANRRALEQLLIGEEYERRGDVDKASDAYKRALEYQPGMAEAVWGLAILELQSGTLKNEGDSIEAAWPLVEKALKLALDKLDRGVPDFDAHLTAAYLLSWMAYLDQERAWRAAVELGEEEVAARQRAAKKRLEESEEHYRSALALNPSGTGVRNGLAFNLRRQGAHRSEEALELLSEGLDLDPFNVGFSKQLAIQLANFGRYRQAMEVLDRFDALPKGKRPLYWYQGEIMHNHHRYDEMLAMLIQVLETDLEGVQWDVIIGLWWMPHFVARLGAFEEAEALYSQAERIPYPADDEWVSWAREFSQAAYLRATGRHEEVTEMYMAKISGMSNEEILDGWNIHVKSYANALWNAGDRERAIELFEALRHFQHNPVWSERQAFGVLDLAWRYQEAGRASDATPLLEETAGYLEEEFDAGIRHPQTLLYLADAYGMLGDSDAALDMLDLAVDYGGWFFLIDMKDEDGSSTFWWEHLQDDPRFIQTRNRMQSIRDQQAANVRNLLNQYDMDAMLDLVIEEVERRMERDDPVVH